MNNKKISGTLEAILFSTGEPVIISRLCDVLELTEIEISPYILQLEKKYNTEHSGIKLLRLNDSLQFCSNPAYIVPIREIMDLKRNTPLSIAAMEVLSLIAYNEPVTKAFIEQVRGVDCSGVVASLTQKGLVEERGRLELPGRPLLYGTTDVFLRCFGINSLAQLPPIPQDEQEEETVETALENEDIENNEEKA